MPSVSDLSELLTFLIKFAFLIAVYDSKITISGGKVTSNLASGLPSHKLPVLTDASSLSPLSYVGVQATTALNFKKVEHTVGKNKISYRYLDQNNNLITAGSQPVERSSGSIMPYGNANEIAAGNSAVNNGTHEHRLRSFVSPVSGDITTSKSNKLPSFIMGHPDNVIDNITTDQFTLNNIDESSMNGLPITNQDSFLKMVLSDVSIKTLASEATGTPSLSQLAGLRELDAAGSDYETYDNNNIANLNEHFQAIARIGRHDADMNSRTVYKPFHPSHVASAGEKANVLVGNAHELADYLAYQQTLTNNRSPPAGSTPAVVSTAGKSKKYTLKWALSTNVH